ncbi:AAA family ATPase [Hymenobacter sp. YC55]|uniref:AAA family ATPase n=1 Tax=Hymenobacter sp. YC55 TaxID=3034019 RepID=UPI0023F9A158|nr:AAA family ATPase [Hymenobacter sp. YC55]MDF7812851.1 AAA family ATPase [Hymenobacter sp. YC55]
MKNIDLSGIPQRILQNAPTIDDVSIIVGENGSGKSTLLNSLSKHFLRNGKNVIAIANSIFDKFDSRHLHFNCLRWRSGRTHSRTILKNAIINMAKADFFVYKNSLITLEYVGFDAKIGVFINSLSDNYNTLLMGSSLFSSDIDKITYTIESYLRRSNSNDYYTTNRNTSPVWLDIEDGDYSYSNNYSLTELFVWEAELKAIGAIGSIDVFLSKNGESMSMMSASSGELSLITSIVYVSSTITRDTVIIVDEPENSLHPKWQKEYVKKLLDLFYRYQPRIIIATHSPIIVNGAELLINDLYVYKIENSNLELQDKRVVNLEETFYKFFDLATPQNRFLSDRLVRLLNVLNNGKMSFSEFDEEINRIERDSYDEKQKNVLKSVRRMARQVNTNFDNDNNNKIRE